jgi:nucleoside-diphosphate kinase
MEKTLAIIKPDGVARGLVGEVVRRIEEAGFKILAMKMIRLDKAGAEGFYDVHRERPFFPSLVEFMSSGPAVVLALEREGAIDLWRKIMGATNPEDAAEGTIRRDFATDVEKNVVHGSDGPDTAAFELGYFFSELELAG